MKISIVEVASGRYAVEFQPTGESASYVRNNNGEYFTLSEAQQVEFCLRQKGNLWRSHTGYQVWHWSKPSKKWHVKVFKTLPEAVRYASQNPRVYKVVDGEMTAPANQPGRLIWENGKYCRRAWPHTLASAVKTA